MGFMVPLAVAGMALSAAGTAYNYKEKKDTAKAVERINQDARKKIDFNTAQATDRWKEALGTVTKDEQTRYTDEAAEKRYAAFEEDTQDVPEATNVMGSTEGAPALVKTDAAKQLGDQLAQMRSQMQARARLGAWDDRGLKTAIGLGRSNQDIGRYGSFSMGTAGQAAQNAQARSQWSSGIGDILVGAGALASMGAGAGGAAGAAGGAAAGAADAGAGMGGMVGANAARTAAAGAAPGFMNWWTMPMSTWGKVKYGTTPNAGY